MMDCVYSQLALDYNCNPQDFRKDGLIFTKAIENKGRRLYPFVTPRLELISMGHGVVIHVSDDIAEFIYSEWKGRTREDVFNSPLIYGVNSYFLPDLDRIMPIMKPVDFSYRLVDKAGIQEVYDRYATQLGLRYDENSPLPEVLLLLAQYEDKLAGIAKAKADCKMMWSIDIDVFHPFRGKGLAAPMVNSLMIEILNRGIIPYYFAANYFRWTIDMITSDKGGFMPAGTKIEYQIAP